MGAVHRLSVLPAFGGGWRPTVRRPGGGVLILRALEVVDAIWAAVEPLLADRTETHPLGCHRRRVADRVWLWGILIRVVTGSSWVASKRSSNTAC